MRLKNYYQKVNPIFLSIYFEIQSTFKIENENKIFNHQLCHLNHRDNYSTLRKRPIHQTNIWRLSSFDSCVLLVSNICENRFEQNSNPFIID